MRWSVTGALLSVLAGETILMGLSQGWIPKIAQGEFLPVVPAVAITSVILVADRIASAGNPKGTKCTDT